MDADEQLELRAASSEWMCYYANTRDGGTSP